MILQCNMLWLYMDISLQRGETMNILDLQSGVFLCIMYDVCASNFLGNRSGPKVSYRP